MSRIEELLSYAKQTKKSRCRQACFHHELRAVALSEGMSYSRDYFPSSTFDIQFLQELAGEIKELQNKLD